MLFLVSTAGSCIQIRTLTSESDCLMSTVGFMPVSPRIISGGLLTLTLTPMGGISFDEIISDRVNSIQGTRRYWSAGNKNRYFGSSRNLTKILVVASDALISIVGASVIGPTTYSPGRTTGGFGHTSLVLISSSTGISNRGLVQVNLVLVSSSSSAAGGFGHVSSSLISPLLLF